MINIFTRIRFLNVTLIVLYSYWIMPYATKTRSFTSITPRLIEIFKSYPNHTNKWGHNLCKVMHMKTFASIVCVKLIAIDVPVFVANKNRQLSLPFMCMTRQVLSKVLNSQTWTVLSKLSQLTTNIPRHDIVHIHADQSHFFYYLFKVTLRFWLVQFS